MNIRKSLVIAVVGLPGSGKTEATARFIERGFVRVGFNDVLNEEFDRRGVRHGDEPEERKVRESLRKEFGMDVAAQRSFSKIEDALARRKLVVVESLYSWEEFLYVKKRLSDQFRVLAIYAPPDIRYVRLNNRPERSLAFENARSRDYAQIKNVHQAGPIAIADWTIKNIGSREEFSKEVDKLIEELLGNK